MLGFVMGRISALMGSDWQVTGHMSLHVTHHPCLSCGCLGKHLNSSVLIDWLTVWFEWILFCHLPRFSVHVCLVQWQTQLIVFLNDRWSSLICDWRTVQLPVETYPKYPRSRCFRATAGHLATVAAVCVATARVWWEGRSFGWHAFLTVS